MRRKSSEVHIGNVIIGGNNPISSQSMTDTDTADVETTFTQIQELFEAGTEMVRVTIMNADDAKAIPEIKELMLQNGITIPLIGDFHFIGHRLLKEHPECAKALDKYRINPGNIGSGTRWDENFEKFIHIAIENEKAVRIGVNAGSLDETLFSEMIEKNKQDNYSKTDHEVFREALVESALLSSQRALELGLPKNKLIVSIKASDLQDMVWCYEQFAEKTDYCLHLGLTEAGSGDKGSVISSAALSILLQQGIGDTIRVSVTPEPNTPRTREVEICKLILQSLGYRQFSPMVTSCPGCGRTDSHFYQQLAEEVNDHIKKNMKIWKEKYPGVETLKIAVMGCVVNGPGESKHANIGISLPGKMEDPQAPVFIDGKQITILKGDGIPQQFLMTLNTYIEKKFGKRD